MYGHFYTEDTKQVAIRVTSVKPGNKFELKTRGFLW